MAAKVQSADSSEQVITSQRKESINEVFSPNDTLDQPCDLVLMVKDGKEFKAHRRLLTDASPFFEKLLKSDMKETQEGVVRLEMFTESVMAATLQFIYTGDVQMLAEDNARDLIVIADYLFLEKLKLLAGEVLVQMLNTSNCISSYYFAERYQCEDLLSNTRKFILANFKSIYASNRNDVLNMSNREVEMWISSDEIDVSDEEDVFKIILEWIDHDRNWRKKYFVDLFRHVRLVYVSRDFLLSDIVTNELVKDNNSCLTLGKDTIDLGDSIKFHCRSVPPRKSLESSVIVINSGEDILCYFPCENGFCNIGELPVEFVRSGNFVPCDGQLYHTLQESSYYRPQSLKQVKYNPYSNSWVDLPSLEEPGRYLRKTFQVRNGDEMYAWMSEPCVMDHLLNWYFRDGRRDGRRRLFGTETDQNCDSRKHTSYLAKYKPETNSWEDVSSFDHLNLRECFCIVANDNFIYFIGGREWSGTECRPLSNVDRYDLRKNQWERVADTPTARMRVRGAAVNEKIYIVGGTSPPAGPPYYAYRVNGYPLQVWEVYDETTNEWQMIAGFRDAMKYNVHPLAIDGELYVLGIKSVYRNYTESDPKRIRIERFNPEENKWETKTEVTARCSTGGFLPPAIVCSMRIFKGLFNIRQVVPSDDSLPVATTTQPSFSAKTRERNCFIV